MAFYYYRLFGLKFKSELEFSELFSNYFSDSDVQITLGNNPAHLPVIDKKGVLFETTQDDFLFQFETVGSFRVQGGNLITIDPIQDATNSEISLFLFGSIMGALLHQRGNLPLHGSSIKINEVGVALIGKSSSGKSTLAAGFAKDGYSILADDISVLTNYDQYFHIHPGLPYLKLWEDVIESIDSNQKLKRVRPTLNKYIKPLNQAYYMEPLKLTKIICLTTKNSRGITHELITGSEKFDLIRRNTYRYQFLNGKVNFQNYFKQVSKLSEQILLYKVERPESPLEILELVEYVKNRIINV